MKFKFKKLIFSFLIICLSSSFTKEKTIYKEDFEKSRIYAEWSTIITNPIWQNPIKTDITPKDNRGFLGQFGNQEIILTLTNKFDLCDFNIDFDLFVIRSWDGSDSTVGDIFAFNVNGTNTAYSFSNWGDSATTYGYQSYPETVNTGKKYPAQFGAIEKQSLGYIYEATPIPEDAVYHLSLKKNDISRNIKIQFMGVLKDGTPTFENESWGIDNIIIKVNEIDFTCSLPDTIAIPGTENFHIPILAKVSCVNEFTRDLSFITKIKFNASVFYPTGLTKGKIIDNIVDDNFNRILTIQCDSINISESNSVVTEIIGTILLGDSITPLVFENFIWNNASLAVDTLINGSLQTKACAMAIRRVQLFKSPEFYLISSLLNREISIALSNVDLSYTTISIYNSLGIELKHINSEELEGKNLIKISTEEFSSGYYYCILASGFNKISKGFMIIK